MPFGMMFMTDMLLQAAATWSRLWMGTSELLLSSAEVITRRGLLHFQSSPLGRLNPDFDGMASEKGSVMFESWQEMWGKTLQLAPEWGLRLYSNAAIFPLTPQAMASFAVQGTESILNIAQAAIAPIQGRVSANA